MKYIAASLDDIAKAFDTQADLHTNTARASLTKKVENRSVGMAVAYRAAADFLRNTTLTGEA